MSLVDFISFVCGGSLNSQLTRVEIVGVSCVVGKGRGKVSGVLHFVEPHGSLSWERSREDASQFGVEWPITGEDRGKEYLRVGEGWKWHCMTGGTIVGVNY